MPCKVSIKKDFKKLEEIYPNLCENIAKKVLKEKDYIGFIGAFNSITSYYDHVWIHPEMYEVTGNDPKYGITLANPLSSLINKEVSEDIWEAFQETCKEQYNNDLDYVYFFVDINTFSQYFKISKEDIYVE